MSTHASRGPGSNQHQDKPPVAPREASTDGATVSGATATIDPMDDDDPYAGESAEERADAHHERIWRGEATGFSEEALTADLAEARQTLADLESGKVSPRRVVGTGYIKPKQVARDYLTERIGRLEEAIATRGRSDAVNKSNAQSAAWRFDEYDAGAIPGEVTRQQVQLFRVAVQGAEVIQKRPDAAADYRAATGTDLDPTAQYRLARVDAYTTDDSTGDEVGLGQTYAVTEWHDEPPRKAYDRINDILALADR